MSSERSASAITSLPKPGALAPAGVGRSRPATVGSAALVLARAVADWDGVMAGISSAVGALGQVGPHPTGSRAVTQPGEKSWHSRRPHDARLSRDAVRRGLGAICGAPLIE